MMKKIHRTIFQLRRDKLSEWEKFNPILRVGEPGYAYDANIFKIGDGVNTWQDLPTQGSNISDDILSRLEALENGASLPNAELLSTITEEKISSWDEAEKNAKEYADKLFSEVGEIQTQKIEQLEKEMKTKVTEDDVLKIVNGISGAVVEVIEF